MQIAMIGCGVMGSALARHFAKTHDVILCDRSYEKSLLLAKEIGARAAAQPGDAIEKADIVILAFKPKDLDSFAQSAVFTPNQMVISILAGTLVSHLKRLFPHPVLIRAIPNLPLVCGEGVIGFVQTPEVTVEKREQVEAVFQGLGLLRWLSEDHLEALSALAGSGPAFIFVLIEAMIDSGVLLGFTQHEARDFVLKTMEGSVALLKATGLPPAELKAKVASPGGTTIAGLKVLEDSGVRGILMDTFQATFLRARELHK